MDPICSRLAADEHVVQLVVVPWQVEGQELLQVSRSQMGVLD